MRKPTSTSDIDLFIHGAENKKDLNLPTVGRGRPKKENTAKKSTLSQTDDDLKIRNHLVDLALSFKNEDGRPVTLNYSESARVGYECALKLAEYDPESFEKILKNCINNR